MLQNLFVVITSVVIVSCDASELTTGAAVIPCIGILSGCYEGCTNSYPESRDKSQPAARCIKRCIPEFYISQRQKDCGYSHAFYKCFNCGYYPAHSIANCVKSKCRPQSRLISQIMEQKME